MAPGSWVPLRHGACLRVGPARLRYMCSEAPVLTSARRRRKTLARRALAESAPPLPPPPPLEKRRPVACFGCFPRLEKAPPRARLSSGDVWRAADQARVREEQRQSIFDAARAAIIEDDDDDADRAAENEAEARRVAAAARARSVFAAAESPKPREAAACAIA